LRAITVENTLEANLNTESLSRSNSDMKMVFVNVGEAEGLLSVNDYPFAFGFGSVSKAGFGLAIPFNFKIVGYAATCSSTDSNRSVRFTIEHYNTSGVKTLGDDEIVSLASNVLNSSINKSYAPGNICIKVQSVNNLLDIDARYRVALYFQSSDQ
jgi:hypothetical protein